MQIHWKEYMSVWQVSHDLNLNYQPICQYTGETFPCVNTWSFLGDNFVFWDKNKNLEILHFHRIWCYGLNKYCFKISVHFSDCLERYLHLNFTFQRNKYKCFVILLFFIYFSADFFVVILKFLYWSISVTFFGEDHTFLGVKKSLFTSVPWVFEPSKFDCTFTISDIEELFLRDIDAIFFFGFFKEISFSSIQRFRRSSYCFQDIRGLKGPMPKIVSFYFRSDFDKLFLIYRFDVYKKDMAMGFSYWQPFWNKNALKGAKTILL